MRASSVETIVRTYLSGCSLKETARQTGVGRDKIRNILLSEGIALRDPRDQPGLPLKQSQERNREIAQAHASGASLASLARTYGVSRQRIFQIVEKTKP